MKRNDSGDYIDIDIATFGELSFVQSMFYLGGNLGIRQSRDHRFALHPGGRTAHNHWQEQVAEHRSAALLRG
jgi:hypothetical protein